jgi:hypothetical protein
MTTTYDFLNNNCKYLLPYKIHLLLHNVSSISAVMSQYASALLIILDAKYQNIIKAQDVDI